MLSEGLPAPFQITSRTPQRHIEAEPPKSPDLLTPPPKALDLRRIEGEGPDLHRHRPEFISPLIWLRGPLARVSLETLVLVTALINLLLVIVTAWEPPIELWMRAPRTL